MRIYEWIRRVASAAGGAGSWFGLSICFILMLLIVANVVGRALWQGVPGTLDLTESFIVIIVALHLASTQARRGHVNVEFVVERLPLKAQKIIDLILLIIVFGFTVLLAWQNWELALEAWEVKESSSTPPYIPYYPGNILLAVGISLLGFQLVVDIWQGILRLTGRLAVEPDAA